MYHGLFFNSKLMEAQINNYRFTSNYCNTNNQSWHDIQALFYDLAIFLIFRYQFIKVHSTVQPRKILSLFLHVSSRDVGCVVHCAIFAAGARTTMHSTLLLYGIG